MLTMSDSALPEHQQPRITNESILAGDLPAAPRNPYIITLWVLAGLAALAAMILYIVGSSSPDLSDYLSDSSLADVATRNANFIAAANALLGVTGLAVVGALLGGAITWKPRA